MIFQLRYDDIDLSPYMIPPLTTIISRIVSQQAVDQLIYRMDNPEAKASVLVLTPELIERQSVKNINFLLFTSHRLSYLIIRRQKLR